MRPTLVFTSGSSALDLLTRFGTLSPASHVAIGIDGHLLHAYGAAGVTCEPRESWFAQNQTLVAELEVLPFVDLTCACAQLGKPYDYPGAIKAGALRVFGEPIKLFGRAARTDKFTCTNFVMLIDPCGTQIPEWIGIDRRTAAPGDLLRAAGPSFRQVA